MGSAPDPTLGDAMFRREAAHALSTPLGSLLLQAELIEHLLSSDKVSKAQQAVPVLVKNCEALGQMMRSVFLAMADMAEEEGGSGDPRSSLVRALEELGDETVDIDYRGTSPRVCLPGAALDALMRRLVLVATTLGAKDAVLAADTRGMVLRLSLSARESDKPRLPLKPFEGKDSLDLWTVRAIAHRHRGQLEIHDGTIELLSLMLPLEVQEPPGPEPGA